MCFPLLREFQAHDILDSEFYPVVRYEQVPLPHSCPFHPEHDRFKIAARGARKAVGFRCPFCNVDLKDIAMVEEHVVQHKDRITMEGTSCYSDYCEMLGCEDVEKERRLAKLNLDDEHVKLYQCKEVFSSCFEGHAKYHRLVDTFFRKFCSKFFMPDSERSMHHSPHGSHWDATRVLKVLGLVFVLFLLIVFYILVIIWKAEASTSPDFQANASLLKKCQRVCSFMCSRKKKIKGY